MGYYSDLLIESPDLLRQRRQRNSEPGRMMDETDKTNEHGLFRVWFKRGWGEGAGRVIYCGNSGEARRKARYLHSLGYRVDAQYWNHRECRWN